MAAPDGIGGVRPNCKGAIFLLFSKHAGILGSNEAKVLAILEAFRFLWLPFKASS